MENYKTPCCKAEWYRKGRADYRCKECDQDFTLELFMLYELDNEINNGFEYE